jgi:hypothetical protein
MLTEITFGFLSALTYRADAKRQVCWVPLSGIYWEDEMPDIHYLAKILDNDRTQIFRLFTIRVRLWKGEVLSDAEQQFWNATYSEVPEWAFFQRKHISTDDQHAQEDDEHGGADTVEASLADADDVTINEDDGVQNISAPFDLTKGQFTPQKKQAWWERLFRRRQAAGK